MSFQHQSDDLLSPATETWKRERQPSVNLIDIGDMRPVQSNNATTAVKKDNIKSKIPYTSVQKFDPLQTRAAETTVEEKSVKIMPTRLPTPRRPVISAESCNADSIIKSTSATTNVQLNPTPPSSPGRRVRHTSIARLAKPSKESLGKANRELDEFDPLISPVREKDYHPPVPMKQNFKKIF